MRKTILTMALAASALTGAACAAQTTPSDPPPPMRGGGEMMMRADANGDGIITKAEAIAEADARFDKMDTNHDGQVSPDEMQAARAMMRDRMEARGANPPAPPPPGNGKRMRGMGRRADADGNGSISKAEWEARAATRFDRMDTNHDGKLDKTELANMAEMRHLQRREMHDGTTPPPPPPPPLASDDVMPGGDLPPFPARQPPAERGLFPELPRKPALP